MIEMNLTEATWEDFEKQLAKEMREKQERREKQEKPDDQDMRLKIFRDWVRVCEHDIDRAEAAAILGFSLVEAK